MTGELRLGRGRVPAGSGTNVVSGALSAPEMTLVG
jgi:hypothetical protein